MPYALALLWFHNPSQLIADVQREVTRGLRPRGNRTPCRPDGCAEVPRPIAASLKSLAARPRTSACERVSVLLRGQGQQGRVLGEAGVAGQQRQDTFIAFFFFCSVLEQGEACYFSLEILDVCTELRDESVNVARRH